MEESILAQSKRKKNFVLRVLKSKIFIISVVIVLGLLTYFHFKGSDTTVSTTVATIEQYDVAKDNLVISIESDGTLKNADNLELNFNIGGTIDKMNVKEGDKLKKGDVIAILETDSLQFELNKAQIDLDIAKANLTSKLTASTALDIKIAETNLEIAKLKLEDTERNNEVNIENAKLNLEVAESNLNTTKSEINTSGFSSEADTKSSELSISIAESDLEIAKTNQESNTKDLQTKLEQAYESASLKADISSISIRSSLEDADMILEIDNDGYNLYMFSEKEPQYKINAKNSYKRASAEFEEFEDKFRSINQYSSNEEILSKLDAVENLTQEMTILMENIANGLDNTIPTEDYNVEKINSMKSSFISNQSKMKSELSNISSARQSVQTAILNQNKQILSDKNSVLSAENKLTTAKQNLEKLLISEKSSDSSDGSKLLSSEKQYKNAQTELESAKRKAELDLKSAQMQVDSTKQQLDDKITPIKATDIATLNMQIENAQINLEKAQYNLSQAKLVSPIDGEIMQLNFNAGETVKADSETPIAIILSENNYEVEVYIEEADILQAKLQQKAYVTLEAIEDLKLEGEVSFIANTATSGSGGIVTYLVKVAVTSKNTQSVKEGMTAYVNFVTAEASDVIAIPVAAVKNRDGKPSVQLANGEYKEVVTGFTDGQKVEIISGLEVGEKVLYKK